MTNSISTSDLCDEHGDAVRVVATQFRSFGGRRSFAGTIATVRVFEDNVLVRAVLEEPGNNRVLVVDGGGSLTCALLGDQIGALAQRNGWSGVVLYAALRDADALGQIDLGVFALGTNPRKSGKQGGGERDVAVTFGDVTFALGAWLAADSDGVIVAETALF